LQCNVLEGLSGRFYRAAQKKDGKANTGMDNLKKAIGFSMLVTALNLIISFILLYTKGATEFRGYLAGTILNLIFVLLWVLGARRGMKSNTLVLMGITLGGFPVRLGILLLFAFGGTFVFQMDTIYFAISFLIGTILSLIIEVWFFSNLRIQDHEKIKLK